MTINKKFLTSVADAYLYDITTEELLAVGKTMLDTNFDVKVANTDIRGGRGAPLQYIYFHSPDMTFTLTDTQWNLAFIGAAVGDTVSTGGNVYTEETVALTAKAGSVVGTPLAVEGTTVYGWCTSAAGTEKVQFATKAFTSTLATASESVCVRYYHLNSAAREIVIPANILPKVVRLVLEAQLVSSESSTNKIGVAQIIVPNATLSGNFTISMKTDGVSTTPLSARALATAEATAECASDPVLAYIEEILDSTNWYDNVYALSIVGGDFGLTVGVTKQLDVRAIPTDGAAFRPPFADLTFASSVTGKATVSAGGLVAWVAGSGTPIISCTITAKTAIDANVICTTS